MTKELEICRSACATAVSPATSMTDRAWPSNGGTEEVLCHRPNLGPVTLHGPVTTQKHGVMDRCSYCARPQRAARPDTSRKLVMCLDSAVCRAVAADYMCLHAMSAPLCVTHSQSVNRMSAAQRRSGAVSTTWQTRVRELFRIMYSAQRRRLIQPHRHQPHCHQTLPRLLYRRRNFQQLRHHRYRRLLPFPRRE